MVVLVDAKYFGDALKNARRNQNIKVRDAAKTFKMSERQYRRCEHGLEPIPENILLCLFHRGFCMLKCQKSI